MHAHRAQWPALLSILANAFKCAVRLEDTGNNLKFGRVGGTEDSVFVLIAKHQVASSYNDRFTPPAAMTYIARLIKVSEKAIAVIWIISFTFKLVHHGI